jgi:hypothetical protein
MKYVGFQHISIGKLDGSYSMLDVHKLGCEYIHKDVNSIVYAVFIHKLG